MRQTLSLFAALAVICAGFTLPLLAGDAAAGKEVYTKRCRVCHADDGNGTPAMQKKHGEKLLPLGGAKVQGWKDAEIAKEIKAAESHKAIVKNLTDADIDNVIAHIRTLKK